MLVLMDEEATNFEDATLTQETFSFLDVVSGASFPEDIAYVYYAERAAYDLEKLLMEMDMFIGEPGDAQLKEWQDRAEVLQEQIAASKYTIHLTGVEDEMIENARASADAEFEGRKVQRKNANGRIERYLPESENLPWLKYFNALVLALHITKIEDPKGRVMVAPSTDEVAAMYARLPNAEKAKLDSAVQSLRVKSSAYEASIDEGFLAKP